MPLRNQVQLICYPNRIGKNLKDLESVLNNQLSDAIGGVHILPFYPSNADGGFSPLTHKEVDPAIGNWNDIERIAQRFDLCCDLTVNHISDQSAEFLDFVRHGAASVHAPLFVDVDALGDITPADLAKIHIRKEKEPFRQVDFADGTKGRVWCTFTERQIDLDYRAAETYQLMEEYIAFLTGRGARLLRLDAFGYTTKRIGSSCFLVEPDVYEILEWLRDTAARYGAECLPEVHDHPSFQHAIARRDMRPYAFALPPLVLHTLLRQSSAHLKHWLRMCPANAITVLDTHDGICIPDVEGALPERLVESLVDEVGNRSGDPILRRSAARVGSVGAIYQLTCTFYDALNADDDRYIAARAIQFFTPGIPQVYYVGLLAGRNDDELAELTGEARDVNRHFYSLDEFDSALTQPVVQRLLALMRLRSNHPAFQGEFELHHSPDTQLVMVWRNGEHLCRLDVDLREGSTRVQYTDTEGRQKTLES